MKKTSLITSVAVIASLGLVGCGGGSGGSGDTAAASSVSTTSISGTAIDPELVGATVCLDLNQDENCTSDEPSATTDGNGNFSLNVSTMQLEGSAPLVAMNGVDKESGEAFKNKLMADVNSTKQNITPLTTLAYEKIKENMDKGLTNVQSGMTAIQDTLGLTSEEMQANMIALANEGNTTALKVALVLQKSAEAIDPSDTLKFYKEFSQEIDTSKPMALLDSLMKVTPTTLKADVILLAKNILDSNVTDPYALAEEARMKAAELGIDQDEMPNDGDMPDDGDMPNNGDMPNDGKMPSMP